MRENENMTDSIEAIENQVTDKVELDTGNGGMLLLVAENEDGAPGIPLSTCQMFVAIQSLLGIDEEGYRQPYSDEKLLRSKDRKEALNRLLYSIDEASEMLKAAGIQRGVFIFNYNRQDQRAYPISFTQAAVLVARLGINVENHRSVVDDVLDIVYGNEWEPKFDPDPVVRPVRRKAAGNRILDPQKIKSLLDQTVIGQDEAKMALAAAIYEQELNDLYNEQHKHKRGFVPLKRKNILIYGPSGTGKTALIKKISEILDKPVAIFDAARLTPSGYDGSSPDEIIQALLAKAGGDVEKASHGIIYLDECDKCFLGASGDQHLGKFKGSVAYELLRMMDGCEVNLGKECVVNTENVQFILGGAFPHLDEIVRERTTGEKEACSSPIGFMVGQRPASQEKGVEDGNLPDATIEDLKRYGLPPELLGRIAVICRLNKLTKEDLVQILSDSDQSPLKQYRQKLSMVNVTLEMPTDAMETVAELALERKLGARGLESLLREALSPAMFKIGNNRKRLKLELKPECFTQGAAPAILPAPKKRRSCKA